MSAYIPNTDAMPQTVPTKPVYFPRSSRVVISLMVIWTSCMIPPPPRPMKTR